MDMQSYNLHNFIILLYIQKGSLAHDHFINHFTDGIFSGFPLPSSNAIDTNLPTGQAKTHPRIKKGQTRLDSIEWIKFSSQPSKLNFFIERSYSKLLSL